MRTGNVILAVFCIALFSAEACAQPAADLAFVDGKLWTLDEKQPEAEALAVWQDRILAVGSSESIRRLVGPQTRVIALHGRRVLPGFHDCHVHLLSGGLQLGRVDLKDAADEAEFGRRLKAFDRRLPPGRWLLGGNWDHDRTFAGKLPTAALLDRYVPKRPCFLSRYDGHMAVANSRALELSGITARTAEPPGGEIHRDELKRPTGLLRDEAMKLVSDNVPPLTDEELAEAVGAALKLAARLGVTSIDDMAGDGRDAGRRLLRHYQQLARQNRLTARIHLYWPLEVASELADLGIEAGFGSELIRLGGLKGFIDGSLGSSTAKMWQPYLNEPHSTGLFVTAPGQLGQWIDEADRSGLAVAVHSIGDRGNSTLLDLFAGAAAKNGARDRRFRIEHAQHLRPEDFVRFAQQDVIASMQPYHAIDDGRWAEGRIGAERCASSYPFRSLLNAGARLAFGSDWPVAPLDPLAGIDAAVNRRTLDGDHPDGWFPEQRITVAEAIRAYTLDAAYADFSDDCAGSLVAGKRADFVVLSRDTLSAAERATIADVQVVMTVMGGKIVYQAPGE